MTKEVDTSKEAVERFIAKELTEIAASVGLPVAEEDKDAMVKCAAILRDIMSERDQLRRDVEEARDKALEDARHVVQLREHACLDYFRKTGKEAVLYEQFDLARDDIRALKARP